MIITSKGLKLLLRDHDIHPHTAFGILMDNYIALKDRYIALINGNLPLQHELLDLITLMPDSQTDEIINYINELKETRKMRDANSKTDTE
jgi:hypothetical protein